ncbi:hypothetical protein BKA70DRAFT_1235399 [Coprinopsis sp. MPI-PUGE-AT-0042]|nr:hypothetical protein BKA70DRAFT_1235399 [Coprinopsis sp. MPI-PUGE-AT-0042]
MPPRSKARKVTEVVDLDSDGDVVPQAEPGPPATPSPAKAVAPKKVVPRPVKRVTRRSKVVKSPEIVDEDEAGDVAQELEPSPALPDPVTPSRRSEKRHAPSSPLPEDEETKKARIHCSDDDEIPKRKAVSSDSEESMDDFVVSDSAPVQYESDEDSEVVAPRDKGKSKLVDDIADDDVDALSDGDSVGEQDEVVEEDESVHDAEREAALKAADELLRSMLGPDLDSTPNKATDSPGPSAPQSPMKSGSATVTYKVVKLPCNCEVTKPGLFDGHLLNKRGFYPDDLPPLTSGVFLNIKGEREETKFLFPSLFLSLMKNMNHKLLWDALCFVQSKQYVSLARVDPKSIGLRPVGRAPKIADQKYELAGPHGTYVTLRAGVMQECYVQTPRERPEGTKFHSFQANVAGFTLEANRERAVTCMALGDHQVRCPIFNSAVTYSTLTAAIQPGSIDIFNIPGAVNESPDAVASGGSDVVKARKMGEGVPVYDGRYVRFDYNKDLPRLHDILPRWPTRDEVLRGHPVVVASVIHAKKEAKKEGDSWLLYPYIQWIIVLGSTHQQKKPAVRPGASAKR